MEETMQTPQTSTGFDRSKAQRMTALRHANEIRIRRAQIKKDVKARRLNVAALIASPPADLETMKVFPLLLAAPKIGRVKANKILTMHRISPSKTIGGLSHRQRVELAIALAAASPTSNSRPQGRTTTKR
jgi:hypothetical protein